MTQERYKYLKDLYERKKAGRTLTPEENKDLDAMMEQQKRIGLAR